MSASKRQNLIDAFFTLAMAQRPSGFGVSAICEQAGVSRSTFYMHFRSQEYLLMAVVAPIIGQLAGELLEGGAPHALSHIWEQRRLSELWRDVGFRERFATALTEAFGGSPAALFAASGVVELLRAWTAGRISATPEEMAERLGSMVRGALRGAGNAQANAEPSAPV